MQDFQYMQRCLELAQKGAGKVSPNPMVGSVIVCEDKIIGEGYHQQYGQSHAEVNAINSVKDKSLLKKSTLYVNLEPCSHFGNTPPCADLIIKHEIPNVVIGCVDTFSKVHGRGIEKLKLAGIKVKTGILENESKELNRRFFIFHEKKRPFVILKWAQTIDGYIDAIRIKNTPVAPLWITDKTSRVLVHKWRAEEDAIMVGTNTAEKDNPKLNVRDWAGNNPLRVLLDRSLRLDNSLSLFDQSIETLILTEKQGVNKEKLQHVQVKFDENLHHNILNLLFKENIQSIIIEGGAKLLNTFIENDLWDEAKVFIGNKFFNNGIVAPKIAGQPENSLDIGTSKLFYYRNISN